MLSKLLSDPRPRHAAFFSQPLKSLPEFRPPFGATLLLGAALFVLASPVKAEGPALTPPKFLGELSCSSSSCHGGAGEKRSQFITWSRRDFHTRSYATLTTARSARIAESLKISAPTQSARCTVCHAPFQTALPAQLAADVDFTKGVSCETCHGPAENWLRSHTRPDWTHQDRVHAGMRDLQDLYVRANNCVACHQNVEADLLRAGHPELIFELDGQSVTEPKHWHELAGWSGAQTWLVGQAAALREMSWQLTREKSPTESMTQRWAALLWLLQQTASSPAAPIDPTPDNLSFTQKWADQLARETAATPWTPESTRKYLTTLAGTAESFRAKSSSQPIQARRAERLALALDRLVTSLNDKQTANRLDPFLNKLFKDAQSLPDFNPNQFAAHLEEFAKCLPVSLAVK